MKKLCKLDEIDDGDARGFELLSNTEPLAVICLRQGQQVFAYKNNCPHTGVNLEWLPDNFLDDTRQYLVCATHGALFQVEDGYCVAGPCKGESLTPVNVMIDGGEIFCKIT